MIDNDALEGSEISNEMKLPLVREMSAALWNKINLSLNVTKSCGNLPSSDRLKNFGSVNTYLKRPHPMRLHQT